MLTVRVSMDPSELFVQLGLDRKPLFVGQYLEEKEWPQVWDVPKSLLHRDKFKPEEPEEPNGDEIFLDADPGPGEQPRASWDCVWITEQGGVLLRWPTSATLHHGSGDYSRLLPPRGGRNRMSITITCACVCVIGRQPVSLGQEHASSGMHLLAKWHGSKSGILAISWRCARRLLAP